MEHTAGLGDGLPPLCLGLRIDEIGNPLGLGQVDLAVLESPASELSGLRETAAERRQRSQDTRNDSPTTVQEDLDDILPSEGGWCAIEQDDRTIDVLCG
jgi:hypothetical protein